LYLRTVPHPSMSSTPRRRGLGLLDLLPLDEDSGTAQLSRVIGVNQKTIWDHIPPR